MRDIFQLDDSSLVDAYKQWCDGILMQIHPHPCFEANRRDEGYGKETGKRRSRNPAGKLGVWQWGTFLQKSIIQLGDAARTIVRSDSSNEVFPPTFACRFL